MERRPPLTIQMGDLRVGDIWNSGPGYRDDGEGQGAVCESVEKHGGGRRLTITWSMIATGEVFTEDCFAWMRIPLMRRAESVPAREVLWNELGLDLHVPPISFERFEAVMDAYDGAVDAGSVRPDEEPDPKSST